MSRQIRMRKAMFPLLFLFMAISLTVVYVLVYPFRAATLDALTFYFALFSTSFILMILFQNFIEERRLHIPMTIGWGLVFIGTFEKFLADFIDTPGLENENFTSALIFFGLLFIAFGLYFWTKQMWDNQRIRDQQHKMIELYTSLMNHDAGNDLQAILGYIETALMHPEGCSAKTIELLKAAKASALRMTSLIKAFKTEMPDTPSRLLSNVEMSALQAEKAHIGLTINIEADDDTKDIDVVGGSMLQMAFANLYRNSAEYAGDNPIVSIRVRRDDDNVVINLTDNGPGIRDEIRSKLFERGGLDDGHGFGLYLTRQIVAACGGTIELLDSEVGAKFRVVLPF